MVRYKMEGLVINHQRRRGNIRRKEGFEVDHIIPYSICMDDSAGNIQFLTKKEHKKKTIIDFKILKGFRKEGWIEKITHYSHELKKPISFLKEEYNKQFSEEKE